LGILVLLQNYHRHRRTNIYDILNFGGHRSNLNKLLWGHEHLTPLTGFQSDILCFIQSNSFIYVHVYIEANFKSFQAIPHFSSQAFLTKDFHGNFSTIHRQTFLPLSFTLKYNLYYFIIYDGRKYSVSYQS